MPTPSEITQNFPQLYQTLIQKLPHLAVHNFQCENSDYSDQLNDSLNAYVCFNGYGLEDCFYNFDSRWNKNCMDFSHSNKCELCYHCIDTEECYDCDFLQDCEHCTNCSYCYDCFGCENCFGCVGLRKKKFHILNQPYPEKKYFELVNKIKTALKNQKMYRNFLPDII